MLLAAFAAILMGALILAGAFLWLKKRMSTAANTDLDGISRRFKEVDGHLSELAQYTDSYVSRGQLDTINKLAHEIEAELEKEKQTLVGTEQKLEGAQRMVEDKESSQQEMKSSKQEDEEKLAELLSTYSEVSNQSIELEQKLAVSLKNLDAMLEELELTTDQRVVIEDLSKALTSAGSLLRDLITEHIALNERLNMLKQQHADLEDEYTRLVEQQLGE